MDLLLSTPATHHPRRLTSPSHTVTPHFLSYSISTPTPAETWAFSRHDENAATQGRRPTSAEAPLA